MKIEVKEDSYIIEHSENNLVFHLLSSIMCYMFAHVCLFTALPSRKKTYLSNLVIDRLNAHFCVAGVAEVVNILWATVLYLPNCNKFKFPLECVGLVSNWVVLLEVSDRWCVVT